MSAGSKIIAAQKRRIEALEAELKLSKDADYMRELNSLCQRLQAERDSYKQDAERLRVSIEQRIDLHYSNSGNFAVIPKGRRVETHGTTAWESDEDYLNGVRAAIDRAIAEGKP